MSVDAAPADLWRRRALAIGYGIVCHLAFGLAVATMIAAMFSGMSRTHGAVPEPWSLVANAALLLQFPVAHSLLLRREGRAVLTALAPRRFGVHLASTTYVIVAALQVFVLFTCWTPSGIIWWQAQGAAFWALCGLYAAAWLMLLKAIWDAGLGLQTGFLGWWAVLRDRAPIFPLMPTGGLFRLVRQPIYVAFALTLWTVPTWTPDQLAVAIVLTAYCLVGPLWKEERFRRRFGASFAAYSRKVPYWLPRLTSAPRRNDLSIYGAAADWWGSDRGWLRTLRNMVPARLAHFDPLVVNWNGKRVLDLGCGGGFMAEALAARGAVVTGVDPSAEAVAAARRHAGETGVAIDYLLAAGEDLPFGDDSFDVVVSVDVLEHVLDLGGVVSEVRRVLRPGGLFLFDTINRNVLATLVMVGIGERLLRALPRGTHDPAMFIRPVELKAILEANGFRVGRFAGFGTARVGPPGRFEVWLFADDRRSVSWLCRTCRIARGFTGLMSPEGGGAMRRRLGSGWRPGRLCRRPRRRNCPA